MFSQVKRVESMATSKTHAPWKKKSIDTISSAPGGGRKMVLTCTSAPRAVEMAGQELLSAKSSQRAAVAQLSYRFQWGQVLYPEAKTTLQTFPHRVWLRVFGFGLSRYEILRAVGLFADLRRTVPNYHRVFTGSTWKQSFERPKYNPRFNGSTL